MIACLIVVPFVCWFLKTTSLPKLKNVHLNSILLNGVNIQQCLYSIALYLKSTSPSQLYKYIIDILQLEEKELFLERQEENCRKPEQKVRRKRSFGPRKNDIY